ncbi:hypothetical protein [Nonomuraea bangladeshensis]|uniref:hypothetical protein n=1 Tax=Nonomuraea bangladeshensis TaxID=404385 RepID=UPI0031D4DFE5
MRRAAKALLPLSREFCQLDKDRAQRPGPDATPPGDDRRQYWTALDPRAFDRIHAGLNLTVSALTGIATTSDSGTEDEGEWARMWLSDPDVPGSWTAVTCRPSP